MITLRSTSGLKRSVIVLCLGYIIAGWLATRAIAEEYSDVVYTSGTMRGEKEGILLEVHRVKETTTIYEGIYFEISITNQRQGNIKIAPIVLDRNGYLDYNLLDSAGNQMCQMALTHTFGPMSPFKVLQPGDDASGYISVITVVCWPDDALRPYLSPGLYHISLRLSVFVVEGKEKRKITIPIDSIPFKVVEPAGDDAIALRLYEEGLRTEIDNPDNTLQVFQKILNEYSHTPYDVLATQALLFTQKENLHLLKKVELVALMKRLLLKHPNCPFNVTSNIMNLAELIPEQELTVLYEELNKDTVNTVSAQYMKMKYPWVSKDEVK